MWEHWLKDIEEEVAEQRGKEEMAKNLLAKGISPEIIAESAGLPVEKIQSLVK